MAKLQVSAAKDRAGLGVCSSCLHDSCLHDTAAHESVSWSLVGSMGHGSDQMARSVTAYEFTYIAVKISTFGQKKSSSHATCCTCKASETCISLWESQTSAAQRRIRKDKQQHGGPRSLSDVNW